MTRCVPNGSRFVQLPYTTCSGSAWPNCRSPRPHVSIIYFIANNWMYFIIIILSSSSTVSPHVHKRSSPEHVKSYYLTFTITSSVLFAVLWTADSCLLHDSVYQRIAIILLPKQLSQFYVASTRPVRTADYLHLLHLTVPPPDGLNFDRHSLWRILHHLQVSPWVPDCHPSSCATQEKPINNGLRE